MIIPLTQGQVAIVDESDYFELSRHKWFALYNRGTQTFYAARKAVVDGRRTTVQMHRELLEAKKGELVDHGNHDTLDNRRLNISIATDAMNNRNARLRKDNKTGFCGVGWNAESGKWFAHIRVNGKQIYLGLFKAKDDAIAARKEALIKHEFHENHGLRINEMVAL